ncbi:MAG: ABC transporter permease, partial [Alphaproteobacteria bacterium]|nr:ABC transporter permease [Alphaproteobacteria bacterium]
MKLLAAIALRHLLARKRQSVVSLLGIVLGVAFFMAISSLMQGSEKDFIRRLVDNSPHITIADEFRNPHEQPVEKLYPDALVELRNVKPATETRGIRGFEQILESLKSMPGVRASPVLAGQALVSFAGRDVGITLNGMIPGEVRDVTTIQNYMQQGAVDELIANPDGIIIGAELARKLSVSLG